MDGLSWRGMKGKRVFTVKYSRPKWNGWRDWPLFEVTADFGNFADGTRVTLNRVMTYWLWLIMTRVTLNPGMTYWFGYLMTRVTLNWAVTYWPVRGVTLNWVMTCWFRFAMSGPDPRCDLLIWGSSDPEVSYDLGQLIWLIYESTDLDLTNDLLIWLNCQQSDPELNYDLLIGLNCEQRDSELNYDLLIGLNCEQSDSELSYDYWLD